MSTVLRRTVSIAAVGVTALVVLGACSPPAEPEPTAAPAGGPAPTETAAPPFPTTVVHSGGETTLEVAPERIFTFGAQQTHSLLALGIAPVASGGGSLGPWREEAIGSLGAGVVPTIDPLDGDTLADVEAVSPDVIVTALPFQPFDMDPTSWLAFYNDLPEVAPTIRPPLSALDSPEFSSSDSWRETLLQMGQIVGHVPEAEAHLASIDDSLAAHAAAHPEFAGKTIAVISPQGGSVAYSKSNTAVAALLEQLGFTYADDSTVAYNSESDSGKVYYLWADDVEQLDTDVLIYIGDPVGAPYWVTFVEASATGADGVIHYPGFLDEPTLGMFAPTALSVPWAVDAFVADLAASIGAP
ncbi:ABC transporter substrate-binding protein [Salinibacterium amurskyense]|uniref:ABC transporter substrate-binding protein n=1 Tax=Salinibacterium amurskyense TaxID=205941 RepID=UPI0012FF3419|nr:ABC transporter substrate-binding protein [Salinibacterium amurskyense]